MLGMRMQLQSNPPLVQQPAVQGAVEGLKEWQHQHVAGAAVLQSEGSAQGANSSRVRGA